MVEILTSMATEFWTAAEAAFAGAPAQAHPAALGVAASHAGRDPGGASTGGDPLGMVGWLDGRGMVH